jgi:hypothetical protein
MSESSLPPFGPAKLRFLLRTFRPLRLKEALGCLYARRRREAGLVKASVLEPRAVQTVHEYLDAHAANLERAVRLGEKAELLDKAGIPSESARNRRNGRTERLWRGSPLCVPPLLKPPGNGKRCPRLRPCGEASVPGFHAARSSVLAYLW